MADHDKDQIAAGDAAPSGAAAPLESGVLRAPLRRKWVTYVAIYFIACLGIAIWGYVDATVIYPKRGEKVIEFSEYTYLGTIGRERGTLATAGIADPASRFDQLQSSGSTNAIELAEFEWLQALSRLDRLSPEYTSYESVAAATARFTELEQKWQTGTVPKPLAGYDIPSQWIIMGVFGLLAAYNAYLFLTNAAKAYRYDTATKTLTVPGGVAFSPDHIEEIDKRRWDKFKLAITLTPDHPSAPSSTVHFDTYRHDKLESWILEMEEEAFGPEEAEGSPVDDAAASNDQNDSQSDTQSNSDSDAEPNAHHSESDHPDSDQHAGSGSGTARDRD